MAIPPAGTAGVRRRDLRGLTVRRRQRVGSDRLHVTNGDGVELGWFDLRDQQVHATSPGVVPAVLSEVERWLEERGDDGGPLDLPEAHGLPGVPELARKSGLLELPKPPEPPGALRPSTALPPPDPRSRVSLRRLPVLPKPYAPEPYAPRRLSG